MWQLVSVVSYGRLCLLQSLLNQLDPPVYLGSMITMYTMMIVMGVWAFTLAGGQLRKIPQLFPCVTGTYNVN